MKKKILHITTGLGDGGSEGVLYRLIEKDKANRHVVVSLIGEGKYGEDLRCIGVEVYSLGFSKDISVFFKIIKLISIIRKEKPSVTQTWMYHSDFIGGIAAKIAGCPKVFWNIRHSSLDRSVTKLTTRIIATCNAILSYVIPDKVICCAFSAKEAHLRLGYAQKKMIVINNGYDIERIRGESTCYPLKNIISSSEYSKTLIGMVARSNPQKDHQNIITATSIVLEKNTDIHLILIGSGISRDKVIDEKINKLKLESKVTLLESRDDIPDIMAEIDIHVLCSLTEGFPNAVAEAMLSKTPCVVTNVGESAAIVGSTGWVVEPKNSVALAKALLTAIEEKETSSTAWSLRKDACRNKIEANFNLNLMVARYNQVWNNSAVLDQG